MKNYGALSLTISSPPQSFTEPLTVAQAVMFLGLPVRDPAEPEEDALIAAMITAARGVAESEYGRDLIPKQYDLSLDSFYERLGYGYNSANRSYGITWYDSCDASQINFPEPLTSVDLVKYRDSTGAYTTLTANTDYLVDAARALMMPTYGNSWPSFTAWPSGAVLIRFTAGYTATHPFWSNDGARILLGMRQLISAWFTGRLPFEPGNTAVQEFPFGVRALFGYGSRKVVR